MAWKGARIDSFSNGGVIANMSAMLPEEVMKQLAIPPPPSSAGSTSSPLVPAKTITIHEEEEDIVYISGEGGEEDTAGGEVARDEERRMSRRSHMRLDRLVEEGKREEEEDVTPVGTGSLGQQSSGGAAPSDIMEHNEDMTRAVSSSPQA